MEVIYSFFLFAFMLVATIALASADVILILFIKDMLE